MTIHILAGVDHRPLCGAPAPADRDAHPHVDDGRVAASKTATCDDCKAMNGMHPPASVERRVSRRINGGTRPLRPETLARIADGVRIYLKLPEQTSSHA